MLSRSNRQKGKEMKFYYNGNLIRTSKTHDYNFALLRYGTCIACSKSREGLKKEFNFQIKWQGVKPEDMQIVEITEKRP